MINDREEWYTCPIFVPSCLEVGFNVIDSVQQRIHNAKPIAEEGSVSFDGQCGVTENFQRLIRGSQFFPVLRSQRFRRRLYAEVLPLLPEP